MKFCPHCGGDLSSFAAAERSAPKGGKYDQTAVWKRLVALSAERRGDPPRPEVLINDILRPTGDGPHRSIVHVVFDQDIVARGGLLHRAVLLEGRAESSFQNPEMLGYLVEDDKIKTVDDVPIGPAYGTLAYWGGEKQHRRWHLVEPIKIEPSRNGNPFFMDDNMLAFGAIWNDFEKMDEAFFDLIGAFTHGVKGLGCVATPLVLEVRFLA